MGEVVNWDIAVRAVRINTVVRLPFVLVNYPLLVYSAQSRMRSVYIGHVRSFDGLGHDILSVFLHLDSFSFTIFA